MRLPGAGDRIGHRHRSGPAHPRPRVVAVHIAHDECEQTVAVLDGMHRDDVGMRKRCGHPRLAEEPLAQIGMGAKLRRQDLHRHRPVKPQVAREKDCPHAAPSEFALDGILVAQRLLQRSHPGVCHSATPR